MLKDGTLVISIAAGVTVAQLLEAAGSHARVCRVMPNTPCLVGETAAAMCLGGKVGPVVPSQVALHDFNPWLFIVCTSVRSPQLAGNIRHIRHANISLFDEECFVLP